MLSDPENHTKLVYLTPLCFVLQHVGEARHSATLLSLSKMHWALTISRHPRPDFWVSQHHVVHNGTPPAEAYNANLLGVTLLFQIPHDSLNLSRTERKGVGKRGLIQEPSGFGDRNASVVRTRIPRKKL